MLRHSYFELHMQGVNLNQIAKRSNSDATLAEVEDMLGVVARPLIRALNAA